MANLVFNKVGDKQVATMLITGDFNLRLVVDTSAPVSVQIRYATVVDGPKATKLFEYFNYVYDEDFKGVVYPKYAEIIVSADVQGEINYK